jgi:hypothetical protein
LCFLSHFEIRCERLYFFNGMTERPLMQPAIA